MTPLYRGNAEILTDPPGSTTFRLLFFARNQSYGLCTLQLAERRPASCRSLPTTIPTKHIGRLFESEAGGPVFFATSAGQASDGQPRYGVYDVVSGEAQLTLAHDPSTGFAWRNGTFACLTRDETSKVVEVHRLREGKTEAPHKLELPGDLSAPPRMVADSIVWTVAGPQGDHRLFVQPVLTGDVLLGPTRELGTTGRLRGHPQFEACRTDESLVLVIRGQPEGYLVDLAVVFRVGGKWHPPRRVQVDSDWYGMTCYGRTASLSWIEASEERAFKRPAAVGSAVAGVYGINRIRCTSSGCQHERADVSLQRHSRASRYAVGDLGKAMAILWRSPLGDVRMRLGPLDQLATITDIPLFDDVDHGGFAWELGWGAIFARTGRGILLAQAPLDGSTATYALRFDATQKVTPVMVKGP